MRTEALAAEAWQSALAAAAPLRAAAGEPVEQAAPALDALGLPPCVRDAHEVLVLGFATRSVGLILDVGDHGSNHTIGIRLKSPRSLEKLRKTPHIVRKFTGLPSSRFAATAAAAATGPASSSAAPVSRATPPVAAAPAIASGTSRRS